MFLSKTNCRALYENTGTTAAAYLRDTISLRFVEILLSVYVLLKAALAYFRYSCGFPGESRLAS